MKHFPSHGIQVQQATGRDRAVANRLLGRSHPPDEVALARGAAAIAGTPLAPSERVYVARHGKEIAGAIAVVILPGRTAAVFGPRLVDGAADSMAVKLCEAALEWVDGLEVVLTQSLISRTEPQTGRQLAMAGFHEFGRIGFLVCERRMMPAGRPESSLEFVRVDEDSEPRLVQILNATYTGTLDCPELDGVRDVSDVLAGYRAAGCSGTQFWWLVRQSNRDIGCLFMSQCSEAIQFELLYMGVAPEMRQRGIGKEIVRFGLWQACQHGAQRLLAAVDLRNEPAIRVYTSAGFMQSDDKRLFARVRRQPSKP